MRVKSKKPLAVAAGALLLVGIGGAAFAYWTNQGAGTGTGTTTTNQAITINQTSLITAVNPGAAAQTLTGTFTNPNTGSVFVTSVTAVLTVTKAEDAPAGTCTATDDYTLTGATMAVGAEVPSGTNVGAFSGATVAFKNLATNQDACKGAALTFTYTSN